MSASPGDRIRIPFAAPEPERVAAIVRVGAAWRTFDAERPAAASPISAEVGGLV